MLRKHTLILMAAFLLSRPGAPVPAEAALLMEPSRDFYRLSGPLLEILVDSGHGWSFGQVTSPPLDGQFTAARNGVNLGITRDTLWIRFTVENRRETGPEEWVLATDIPYLIHADLYWPDEDGLYTHTRGGTSVPLSERSIPYRGQAFSVNVPGGAARTGYLFFSAEETLLVDLKIMTPGAFQRKERVEMNRLLVIVGIFLAVSFSTIMIFFYSRDTTYLFFVFFITSFGAFLASNFGLGGLFLWPESPTAARLVSPLASGLTQFWGLLFCRKFVSTPLYRPKMDRLIRGAVLLAGLSVPVTLVDSFAGNVFVGVLSLFVFSLALIACVARLRNRYEPARLFIAAMAVALLGGFLSWLMVFGFLGFNVLTFGLGPLALVAGMVLFTFSIGNRLYVLQINYRRIFDGVNDPIYLYSPDTRSFGEVNRRACDAYGYTKAEWAKLKIEDILDTSGGSGLSPEELEDRMRRALEDTPQILEALNRRKGGERFWGELNLIRTSIANRRGLLVVTRDITEHKRFQERLEVAYRTWQTTFDAMNDAVMILDPDGVIVLCNRTLSEFVNRSREEIIGRPCWDVVHGTSGPVQDCPCQRMKRTGRRETLALAVGDRHLEITADPLLDAEGNVTGSVHILSDVTSRKHMEEELLRVQKMESVGVLAGGIAHDFNNILTVIWGNVSLARIHAPADARIHAPLEQAEIASQRARDLSQQLLTFARGGAPVKKPVPLGKVCREALRLAVSGSPVTCVFEGGEDPWWAQADEAQIGRVFCNIALNAVHAMPDGGRLRMRARSLDPRECDDLSLKSGPHVEFVIQDEGVGIRPEHLDRIFDPYFTTKQTGSGLGLAIAYSIVSRHEGRIRVSSVPGKGTTFRVVLPLLEGPPAPDADGEKEGPAFGKGRVLVMDDDPMVRDLAGRMLVHLGYHVAVAKEGGEALDLYQRARESGSPFDVVILDLTVPGGMGGKEAIRRLLEIHPEARAVVSSGYSSDPIMADYRSYGFVGVIPKPYRIHGLSTVLKAILEDPA